MHPHNYGEVFDGCTKTKDVPLLKKHRKVLQTKWIGTRQSLGLRAAMQGSHQVLVLDQNLTRKKDLQLSREEKLLTSARKRLDQAVQQDVEQLKLGGEKKMAKTREQEMMLEQSLHVRDVDRTFKCCLE